MRARWEDRGYNRRVGLADQRILVVRHYRRCFLPEHLVEWLEERHPELLPRFEIRTLPVRVRDWSPYVLHAPLIQDPVEAWSPRAYAAAMRVTAASDAAGVPTLNRVERLANAAKSTGGRLIAGVGLRTPETLVIEDPARFRADGCPFPHPYVVREDLGHTRAMYRVGFPAELDDVPLETMQRPIAVEFVDTRDEDGLHRKYRYLALGERGLTIHMHVQRDWIVRGRKSVYTDAIRAEEEAYLSGPDPFESRLQAAREALQLDMVAFDYSLDAEGRPVVWEANPYPYLHRPGGRRTYRLPTYHRAFAMMVRMIFERGGLAVPERLEASAR